MRKITVLSMITLDGVMQAPGGPDEDKSNGFKFGGWTAPYIDEVGGEIFKRLMKPSDLLLGRKTFEIFANYWPGHADLWPGVNDVSKYVVSKKIKKSDPLVLGWKNSNILKSISDIKKLKSQKLSKSKNSDIQVWGSATLIQSLLKNDLVDELWLLIYPLTLGKGKKLFEDKAIPATFKLIESTATPRGVIISNFKRAGKVKTGNVGS